MLRALVEQVVVHLLRHYSNIRRSEELELSRVGLIDRRIRRSVELMHAQLEQDLSLKEIAAASYLSPFHFLRVFKKLTRTTPHAYLASIRTSRAQLLLAEPSLSVTEISSRVGYSSPSHFTKAFSPGHRSDSARLSQSARCQRKTFRQYGISQSNAINGKIPPNAMGSPISLHHRLLRRGDRWQKDYLRILLSQGKLGVCARGPGSSEHYFHSWCRAVKKGMLTLSAASLRWALSG